jgi:hypothetical protein
MAIIEAILDANPAAAVRGHQDARRRKRKVRQG